MFLGLIIAKAVLWHRSWTGVVLLVEVTETLQTTTSYFLFRMITQNL